MQPVRRLRARILSRVFFMIVLLDTSSELQAYTLVERASRQSEGHVH
jgi:hypothetical protein